jgi:ribosome-associated toxin RatA of RatAB toxin-antitoxin module
MVISGAHEVEVQAPAERCFAILLDVPAYPEWWPGATRAEVVEPGPPPEIVLGFDPHAPGVGEIELRLRLESEAPTRMVPKLTGGRLSRLDGPGWTLTPKGEEACTVRYEITAEMATGLPGFLERGFAGQGKRFMIDEPVEALRTRAQA